MTTDAVSTREYKAFTTFLAGPQLRLINDAIAFCDGRPENIRLQWDTGASNTCVSHELVNRLGLVPDCDVNMSTPTNDVLSKAYLLDVMLPNGVGVKDVRAWGADIGRQGIDMLVGMDVMLLGEFSVSYKDGITSWSFRVPAMQNADLRTTHDDVT